MKILLCTWCLTRGGAERVASLWAQGFFSQGHTVDFLLGSHSSPITYEIPENSKVYYETKLPDALAVRIFPQKWRYKRLLKIIQNHRYDLIIYVIPPDYNEVHEYIQNTLKIPIIVTEHNSYERPSYAPMGCRQQKQKFRTNKNFVATTVLTEADKKYLIEKMGRNYAQNTFVLPNPCSYNSVKTITQKRKSILAAGRLDAWHCKGFDILIKAWNKIATKYPDWILNIAGGGSANCISKLLKDEQSRKQMKFLGFVDMVQQYRESSIFVLSSRYEGFGMVLVEAMSQGCACIACDYKGRQREIIQDDSQGIICPVDDVDALANAIEKMIVDEAYRNECQKNAIERSKYYALPNIMERWNVIFRKLNIIQ